MPGTAKTTNTKILYGPKSVNDAVKSICDIMRRGNVTSAVQYVPELTWILFLCALDDIDREMQEESDALGVTYTPPLHEPYRWRDWAAPDGDIRKGLDEKSPGAMFAFVNDGLIPYLKGLKGRPDATARQKVISEIMSGVRQVGIDTERNFLDVLDRVHRFRHRTMDKDHVFGLSQVYEGLLLKMGEKNNDGGQFFTPRQVIRAMVRVIDPRIGETIYDPGSGTGGFLAQSYEHIEEAIDAVGASDEQYATLKERTFYGCEKESLIYPIALANLVLHGIDHPHIWHGNTLTGREIHGDLFASAPHRFDVVLTNPPFGGKEGRDARNRFDYKTSATQVLYLQHVMDTLKPKGRCGIVVDEGLLFRTNEEAFVETKRRLLDECNLWCVVSLPGGVFTQAGASVKTNLLFFTKGECTKAIWYYDLSDLKVTKRRPLTLARFGDFFQRLPARSQSKASWTVDVVVRRERAASRARPFHDRAREKSREAAHWKERLRKLRALVPVERDAAAIEEASDKLKRLTRAARQFTAKATGIENAVYDLRASNPNKRLGVDTRTPDELLAIIEEKGEEVREALAVVGSVSSKGLRDG
uniref:site-specific DNA-methyltransferase (adenine-specific) n=1 Tax=Candidatus Kentrum sp. LFY TaxID=2126342 RepID=A0A450UPR3_9GAMM|nr:MAG: type I restriction enzyme M protein [Candidatus Kentron sp. LFY]